MEWIVGGQMVLGVLCLEAALLTVSLPRLTRRLRAAGSSWGRDLPVGRRVLGEERTFALAGAAARFCRGRNGCLRQALLRLWLLAGEGGAPELVIGVRQDAREPFGAHAWVESERQAVGEPSRGLRGFAELARF